MRSLIGTARGWCLAATVWAVLAGGAAADELADKLAAYVGKPLDLVELGSGKRFVRPTLDRLVERDGTVTGLRLKPEGEKGVTRLALAGIVKIVAGRETVHEADATGIGQQRGKRARETFEKQQAESQARMQERGLQPWPALTAEQHAAEVDALRRFVEEVREPFPALRVTETHEFIVATDIPADQMAPYVASLDAMHDFLCDIYGIPRGEPLWKGKCLVVAFLDENHYLAFEERFMKVRAGGTHGMCHQSSTGRVVMACHRGPDAAAFAHMLVHETSHGFNFRWMSPQMLPNWLNEGIAEWVGTKVVPHSNQVPLKEARALDSMRSRGDLGEDFFGRRNLAPIQYGMASSLVTFLANRDVKKFAAFVKAVKEGASVEESLQQSFKAGLDDLVKAYGAAVGVPNLRR